MNNKELYKVIKQFANSKYEAGYKQGLEDGKKQDPIKAKILKYLQIVYDQGVKDGKKSDSTTNDFIEGEYIIYINNNEVALGRIKSLHEDGAFVCYHEGDTAAKTPYSHMYKLINEHVILDTDIGRRVWIKW